MSVFGPRRPSVRPPPLRAADFPFADGRRVEREVDVEHGGGGGRNHCRLLLFTMLAKLVEGCDQAIAAAKRGRLRRMDDAEFRTLRLAAGEMREQAGLLYDSRLKGKVKPPPGGPSFNQPPLPPAPLAVESVLAWADTVIAKPGKLYLTAGATNQAARGQSLLLYVAYWSRLRRPGSRTLGLVRDRLRTELLPATPAAAVVAAAAAANPRPPAHPTAAAAGAPQVTTSVPSPAQSPPKGRVAKRKWNNDWVEAYLTADKDATARQVAAGLLKKNGVHISKTQVANTTAWKRHQRQRKAKPPASGRP